MLQGVEWDMAAVATGLCRRNKDEVAWPYGIIDWLNSALDRAVAITTTLPRAIT